jgi:hypothetical protein
MHKQTAAVFKGERQLREEFAMGGIEVGAGPVDGLGGDRIHAGGANGNRSVVIAGERDSAALDLAHDGIDGEGGIGAITDIVTHENEAADACATRVVEAGLKGLPIGVNVSEDSNPHNFTRAWHGRNSTGAYLGRKSQEAQHARNSATFL